MHRLIALVSVVVFASSNVAAQDWAKARLEKSPRHLEYVKVKHGNREVTCFVAITQGDDRVFVSWRLLGTDPDGITFNLYRATDNGPPVRLNDDPITKSTNYSSGSQEFSALGM